MSPFVYEDVFARRNPDFARRVMNASFEQLCAAWCYLDEREGPHTWRLSALLEPANVAIFARYRDLGSRLRIVLNSRHADRDKRLRTRIRDRQSATLHVAEFAEALNDWRRRLREQVDVIADGTRHADGRGETGAEDLQEMIATLEALKSLVLGIGGPATFIVRQGLEQDLHVLQRALAALGATS